MTYGFPVRARPRAMLYQTFSALRGSPHPLLRALLSLGRLAVPYQRPGASILRLVLVALRRPHRPCHPFSPGFQHTGVSRGDGAAWAMGTPIDGTRSIGRTMTPRSALRRVAGEWYNRARDAVPVFRVHVSRPSQGKRLAWSETNLGWVYRFSEWRRVSSNSRDADEPARRPIPWAPRWFLLGDQRPPRGPRASSGSRSPARTARLDIRLAGAIRSGGLLPPS